MKGAVLINRKSWTLKDVDELELQHHNYKGLFFWYNQILREIADINKNSK
jgi:hypothetical protein